MGASLSSGGGDKLEDETSGAEVVGSNPKSRTRSCMVSLLSENLRVQSDLTHTMHQLTELGNMEALEYKLRKGEDVNQVDGDQFSTLHCAARHNQVGVATLLLRHRALVDPRDPDLRTPLHIAARCRRKLQYSTTVTPLIDLATDNKEDKHDATDQGDVTTKEAGETDEAASGLTMIQLLHQHHAEVNAQDRYGQTPLHFAAMTGNLQAAKDLVDLCRASVEIEDNQQMTPLIVCASHGHLEIAQLLLNTGGANLRQADSSRQTALHRAAKGGHVEMVRLLLDKAKNMKQSEAFLEAKDTKMKTALFHAASNGHLKVVELMLEAGADGNAETSTMATPLHAAASVGNVDIIKVLLKHKVDVDGPDIYQRTPLMYAAAGNHTGAIKLLAQRGADKEHRDLNQLTALLIASQSGHAAAVQMLVALGAEVRADDKLDKTAVYLCAEQGKQEALKVLLSTNKCKVLLDAVDCYGLAPLHSAVVEGRRPMVEALLKAGASPTAKTEDHDSILHLAAKHGHTSLLLLLIPYCRQLLNSENDDLNTPLHLACRWGHEGAARNLIDAGADLAASNAASSTPLHLASASGHVACCKLLLDFDAPHDKFNKEHRTPLMVGVANGHVGVTKLLLDHGASITATDKDSMNALQLAILMGHRDVAMVMVRSPVWEAALRHVCHDAHGRRLTPFRMLIERLPAVAEEVLNRCITDSSTQPNKANIQIEEKNELIMNFEFLDDTYQVVGSSGVSQYDQQGRLNARAQPYTRSASVLKNNHPLMLMVEHRRSGLMAHPVCVNLIKHKWSKYGSWVYYGNLLLYLLYLFPLTAYVLAARDLNWVDVNTTHPAQLEDAVTCHDVDWEAQWYGGTFLEATKWMVVAVAAIEVLKEVGQFFQAYTAYFSGENLVELTCYVCAVLFVLDYYECPIKKEWQWQVGAMSVFLSWMNLLLFIRVFPFFGIYVIMFTQVLTTFLSFFLVFFFFIVAFALSFYTVLSGEYSFRTPAHSLMRTAVMMIGEIDYDEVFNNEQMPLEYPEVTYILLMAFLIFMSLIIMNLLVGLAVDDIKGVQEQAVLQKLAMQTKLVLEIEVVVPEWIRRQCSVRQRAAIDDTKTSWLEWLFSRLNFNEEVEVNDSEQLRQEVVKLKTTLEDLTEMKTALRDLHDLAADLARLRQQVTEIQANTKPKNGASVPQ